MERINANQCCILLVIFVFHCLAPSILRYIDLPLVHSGIHRIYLKDACTPTLFLQGANSITWINYCKKKDIPPLW